MPHDRHQKLMLQVRHACRLRLVLAPAVEAAQGDAELQQPLEFLLGQTFHHHLSGLTSCWLPHRGNISFNDVPSYRKDKRIHRVNECASARRSFRGYRQAAENQVSYRVTITA